jgi:NADPH:quinone reductase-like Zn-dependent oxidoreductase
MSNSNLDPLRIAIPEAAPHRIAAGYSCAVGRKLLSWMGFGAAQYVYHFVKPDGASLSKVSRMVEEGKIKPIVEADSVFPLEQMAAAQMKVRDGHVRGKVVVRVTQD